MLCYNKNNSSKGDKTGAALTMCAANGATICKSDNWILTQVAAVPEEKPDLILFDGYTNDAYGKVPQKAPIPTKRLAANTMFHL